MFKFFRLIRQQLLSEGKTSKYFKYAIGEIILVVIGILIALQINNWNANQKLKSAEKVTLTNIYKNLAIDSVQFAYYNDTYKQVNQLHLELFKVGFQNKTIDSISELILIRRSLYFKQIISSDLGDYANNINNAKIKEALISYSRSVFDMEATYSGQLLPLIENQLKPLLAEKQLYNTQNWFYLNNKIFKDYSFPELDGQNMIDHNRFLQFAKTAQFQQLLFELNIKWNDFNTRVHIVSEENSALRTLIHSELKHY